MQVVPPEQWPHVWPPDDPRHIHHTDAGGNCDNPDCDYNADVAYYSSYGQDGSW